MRRLAALAFTGLVACQGAPPLEPPPTGANMIDDQLKQDLEVLKNARILFAHHSVGDNLLEGLGELSKEANVALDIVPVDQKRTGDVPRIEQIRPGGNGKGLAKIEDFEKRVLQEPADGAQLVSMKLCFADFAPNTNVDELINRYKAAIDRIKKERPELQILHITTPATQHVNDTKTKLKRMIGKEVWEDAALMRRFEYNERLKEAFRGEPIFDLQEVESKRPSGQRDFVELGGRQFPTLYAGYAKDPGHLNEVGRKVGARAFAHAVAEVLRKRATTAQNPAAETPKARID